MSELIQPDPFLSPSMSTHRRMRSIRSSRINRVSLTNSFQVDITDLNSVINGSEKISISQQMEPDKTSTSPNQTILPVSSSPNQPGTTGSQRKLDPECSVEMEIISDPHFLMTCLRDRIIGQKRCEETSQFVIFMDTHVIKGPYLYREVTDIFYRKDYFLAWQTPHVILPEEIIISTPNGLFLRYPNLSQGYPTKYRWHTEKFKTLLPTTPNSSNHSGHPVSTNSSKPEGTRLEYRVLRKRVLVSLYDYLNEPDHDWIYQSMPTLLLALIHCYILKIGDMCLSNILVDTQKRQIYLIDFDDTITKDRKDEFFYFRDRPNKSRAKLWIQQARPHYPWLIEQLSTIVTETPHFKHRVRNTIFRLARYVYTSDLLESSSSDSSDSSSD